MIIGLFAGLSIISYFYKIEIKPILIKNQIRNKIDKFNKILMGENDKFEWLAENLTNSVSKLEQSMLRMEQKTDERFDKLEQNYNELKLDVNKKFALLDKAQGITKEKIAIYISVIAMVAMTVLQITIK